MSLRQKMIEHIQEITGDKNANLWTLNFDESDANTKLCDISSPYINGIKIRTNEEVSRDINYLIKNPKKYSTFFSA
jgi:hypothetical protein